MPKFSVLMANYNNEKYISDAIQSVMNQTFTDWELLIINDGSTDNSLKKIEPYLNDERITLIINESNIGVSKSLCKLVAESNSEIFGTLDSDDVLTPDAIDITYSAHIENENHGLIYTQFMYCDKGLQEITIGFCKYITPSSMNLREVCASAFRTFKKKDYLKTYGFRSVESHTPAIREAYPEDHDIVFQMEEVTQLYYVDKICYKHRILSDSASNNPLYKNIGYLFLIDCKYDAYLRRKKTNVPNLSKFEMSIDLMRAVFLSLFLKQYRGIIHYFRKSISIYPMVLFALPFVFIQKIFERIKKIKREITNNTQSISTDYQRINKEIQHQLYISTLRK